MQKQIETKKAKNSTAPRKPKFAKGLPSIYSVQDIESYYSYSQSGHWFDAATMRFFRTRLTGYIRKVSDEVYLFVTSERNPSGVRAASIRIAKFVPADNFAGYKIDIANVGEFHSYASPAAAAKAMKQVTLQDATGPYL